jgi:hypothetical protein
MGVKYHTIFKHDKIQKYKKNLFFYATKQPTTVLQQVNHCNTVEAKR